MERKGGGSEWGSEGVWVVPIVALLDHLIEPF